MEPALSPGAVAFVQPRPPEEIRVGDILVFRHPDYEGRLVSHRVVSIDRDGAGRPLFHTKGDANDAPDSWSVQASDVVGTVRLSVPHLGYVWTFVRTPRGFLLLVGLPGALIISAECLNLWRELRRGSRA